MRFTLLLVAPLHGPAWQTNVHLVLFVVVAEIVTVIGAAVPTTRSFVVLLPPEAFPGRLEPLG